MSTNVHTTTHTDRILKTAHNFITDNEFQNGLGLREKQGSEREREKSTRFREIERKHKVLRVKKYTRNDLSDESYEISNYHPTDCSDPPDLWDFSYTLKRCS